MVCAAGELKKRGNMEEEREGCGRACARRLRKSFVVEDGERENGGKEEQEDGNPSGGGGRNCMREKKVFRKSEQTESHHEKEEGDIANVNTTTGPREG